MDLLWGVLLVDKRRGREYKRGNGEGGKDGPCEAETGGIG